MTSDTICPICGFQGVAADNEKCPQCDADLSCFRVLDSLPDTLPRQRTAPRGGFWVMGGTLLLLSALFGVLFGWVFRSEKIGTEGLQGQIYPVRIRIDMEKELERRASKRPPEFEPGVVLSLETIVDGLEMAEGFRGAEKGPDLPAEEEKKQDRVGSREGQDQERENEQGDRFWIYRTAGDDTLWKIAQKCYGSGWYYPVLLKHNRATGVYDLREDLRIRILKDVFQAGQLYKRIIVKEGHRVCYLHVVEAGDTLQSLARKFYGTEDGVDRILARNPDLTMAPGEEIKIELE